MQQVVHLCWQRKNKICCCVFHFESKYRVVLGKCKLLGKSIKYLVSSIKKVIQSTLPAVGRQVWDSGNWIFSTSSFRNRNSAFDIFNSVPRISYFFHCTWYFVQCTISQTPYSPNWCNTGCLLGRWDHREICDLGVLHKMHKGFLLGSSSGCSPCAPQWLLDGWAGWNLANRSRCRTWSPSGKWGCHSPCRNRCLFPYWAYKHRWRVFLFLFGVIPGRKGDPIGPAILARIFGWGRI